ncbi:YisL family protein [Paraliobacillus ryukyuensis]|uniref:YisL family protein n=1 Tax=Paraliobacillus ryukyuensis TaxID=200904 RepID=UPI0009A8A080|nr:YisL family protein [Paraliobacillus ryukyuensis]
MIHLHITSWALTLVLFVVAFNLYRADKHKAAKITHMITRLMYLLVLYSGGDLLVGYFQSGTFDAHPAATIVKVLAGLWVIACVEILLVRYAKGKPVVGFFVQLTVAVVLALVLGFGILPWGLLPV